MPLAVAEGPWARRLQRGAELADAELMRLSKPVLAVATAFVGLWSGAPGARAEGKCPQVHIVFDRSGSMGVELDPGAGTGVTKWMIARDAMKKFLGRFDGSIRFGFMFFPGTAVFGGEKFGGTDETACAEGIQVRDPAYGTGGEISGDLDTLGPIGFTPTGQSLEKLVAYAPIHDPGYDNFVLLITDGEPNCEVAGKAPVPRAVSAIEALKADGIRTFVLGFGVSNPGAGIDLDALDAMADAGGMPRTPPATRKFYDASDPDQFAAALDEIAGVVGGATLGGCTPKGGPKDGGGAEGGGAGGTGGGEQDGGPGGAAGQGGPGATPRGAPGCACATDPRNVAHPAAAALLAAALLRARRRARRTSEPTF